MAFVRGNLIVACSLSMSLNNEAMVILLAAKQSCVAVIVRTVR
jgi:hypothetical protein